MAAEPKRYRLKDKIHADLVDAAGERFRFRGQKGEVRIPKSEREELALEHLVAIDVAEIVRTPKPKPQPKPTGKEA